MKLTNLFFLLLLLLGSVFLITSCDDDAPPAENEEEAIEEVSLTFTPVDAAGEPIAGAAPVVVEFTNLMTNATQQPSPAVLAANASYNLQIEAFGPNGEDITEEIDEEDEAHMFFFKWTQGLFSNPSGSGNIDSRSGVVNYEDFDDNNQPVGLSTTWTTGGATAANGTLRIVLKHQPGEKSATSTVDTGETDIDLNVLISVED